MRTTIRDRIESALGEACRGIAGDPAPQIVLETPRDPRNGDLATNLALRIAREKGEKAREIAERIAALKKADPGNNAPIPVDLVTSSASGLDPHISPAAAEYQIARVAKARGLDVAAVRQMIAKHTEGRTLGLLGEPRVNVVELNLDLDGGQR